MRYCVIKVGDFSYAAFSPSTCEAVADALKRFPHARSVSVRTRMQATPADTVQPAPGMPCLARRPAPREPQGAARLAVAADAAGDVAGQVAWGKALAYCAPALH